MRRAVALLLAAHCAVWGAARAQAPAAQPLRAPAAVRFGKWATLGAAVAFTALGAATHDRADRDYDALLAFCRDHGPCPIGPDGRYANAGAEALFGRVRDGDRRARAWLLGGEVALAGSVVLFVLDLRRQPGPGNIPYSPYVAAGRFGTQVGVQVALKRP